MFAYSMMSLQSYLEKLLRLPSYNNYSSWKDWEDRMQRSEKLQRVDYPIRYFLCRTTFDRFLLPMECQMRNIYWWVRHHTINRYHVLDLRQPPHCNFFQNDDAYAYGWRDTDTRMLFAMFNLLCQFVEKELDTVDVDAGRLVQNPELRPQYEAYVEIKALYHYWKTERHQMQRQYNQALDEWSDLRRKAPKEEVDAIWNELNALENKINDTEDEKLLRLIKIRRYLWS
jgi:hypothetical protein